MKKTNKIIVALSIILVIITICGCVFADIDPANLAGGTLDPSKETGISNLGKQIVAVIRNVGIVISVVILLVLGIKYMMGSAEEKADYKKSMIPYLVGAILIFASTTIVGVVVDMADALNTNKP